MNKPLILVIEDDKPVRTLITTTLKAHDYRYLEAPTGETAILESTSHNPDILLLDEPCSGLDAESRARYLTLLDQLAAPAEAGGLGVHLIFVSHHGEDAPLCINREARMEDGRLTVLR